jgi:hypothetical protein
VVSALSPSKPADRRRKGEGGTGAIDPQRCREEAVRRARKTLRRFCKEHLLFFMWTLTYGDGGQRDLVKLRRQVETLIAKVVAERGGRRFPYAYVVELHKDGERFHVHVAAPFWFAHARLTLLWGHGHVWCTDKRKRGEARVCGAVRAASYLAKYVDKTFEHSEFGRHRYEVARGWKVTSYQISVRDLDEGQRYAEVVFMAAPEYVWHSCSCEGWAAPPVRVLFFTPSARDG